MGVGALSLFLNSLRGRVLLLVCVPFASLLGLLGYQAVSDQDFHLQAMRQRVRDAAAVMVLQKTGVVERTRLLATSLAQATQGPVFTVSSTCLRKLSDSMREARHIAKMLLILPAGETVCSTLKNDREVNFGAHPEFHRALLTPNVVIGEARPAGMNGRLALPFYMAIRDNNDKVLGVVMVVFDLAWLNGEIGSGRFPPGSQIGLIAADGTVLSHSPDPEGWAGRRITETSFFKSLIAPGKEQVAEATGFDGEKRVVAVTRFAETTGGPILLWVGIPRQYADGPVGQQFSWTLGLSIALLTGVFGAVYWGGNRLLVRPVEALAKAARRLGQGDVSARSGLNHSNDEFGQLAGAFDDMAQSLSSLRQTLRGSRVLRVLAAGARERAGGKNDIALAEDTCRALVDGGGYRLAWVSYLQGGGDRQEPVACWGLDAPSAQILQVLWGRALRQTYGSDVASSDDPFVIRDIFSGTTAQSLRDLAGQHSFASGACFPLTVDGALIGSVSICAQEADAFDVDEIVLLKEAVKHLALAIAVQRANATRLWLESSLVGAKDLFRAASNATLDVLFFFRSLKDETGQVVDLECTHTNGRARAMFGEVANTFVGKRAGEILPFDKGSGVLEKFLHAAMTGAPFEGESETNALSGGPRWMWFQVVPLRDGLAISVQDISARKRDEQALRDRALQQGIIASLGRSALSEADPDHLFAEAAAATAQGLGVVYSKVMQLIPSDRSFVLKAGVGWEPDWVGRRIAGLDDVDVRLAGELSPRQSWVIDSLASDAQDPASEILRAHGIVSGLDVAIVGSEGLCGVLGVYSREPRRFSADNLDFLQSIANILATAMDRNRGEEQLAHLAQYDPLTDLPNRALLKDRLSVAMAEAQRSGKRLVVMYMDLDRFKNVNDSFGHDFGDKLLQEVAHRLSAAVRASDTVSRQGGDEFLVVLPEVDSERDAARVAEKLIASIAEPVTVGGVELSVTGSIGIACYPDNGNDIDSLLRNADAAMYAAKEMGRDRYQFYSQEMNAHTRQRLMLETDLRRAIERNELFLQFQPQVALGSLAVVGVEVLVRWQHPVHGEMQPDDFIPIAEEIGFIASIGRWVLEAACLQQAQWVREGIAHGAMAVNVSAPQFRQPAFVATVMQILAQTGLEPGHLELEVTESIVMQGTDVVREKLMSLARLGVKFAIDDFGTGYSNLSYLKRFPIHRLKIDQSFISALPGDKESRAIVQAVVSMGHSLGLKVIAEGVETEAQAEFLQALQCDDAQGFLYARPLLPADCAAFLRSDGWPAEGPVPQGM